MTSRRRARATRCSRSSATSTTRAWEIELATKLPEGNKVVALTVTHLVTERPTEAHVFASLLYGKRLVVVTERGLWSVDSGAIGYVGEPAEPKDPPKPAGGR